jgi:hypothetical protein
MIEFSFLLPTRGRPEQVRRFAQSVIETAADPSRIEVILCVDEDDPDSHHIDCLSLPCKTVLQDGCCPAGTEHGGAQPGVLCGVDRAVPDADQ